MNKDEILNALHNVLNNFVVGHTLVACSNQIDWRTVGATTCEMVCQGWRTKIDLAPILGGISSLLNERPIVIEEIQKMIRRSIIREGHELVLLYCSESNQIDAYKSLTWFEYARIVRNTVSHKQAGLIQWPQYLRVQRITSVKWRHKSIDETMDGKELVIYDAEVCQLLADQIYFVTNTLK